MRQAELQVPLSDSDRHVLAFLAAHPFVLSGHIQSLLKLDARAAHERLVALQERRLLRRVRVAVGHDCYFQITHLGLAVIGSDLPPPCLDFVRCRHDLYVAWVWIAAERGVLGRFDRVLSKRVQRSHDAKVRSGEGSDPLLAHTVPSASDGTDLHYSDLLLVGVAGERVAVEIMLTGAGQRQLESVLASYRSAPEITGVLYLSETPAVRRTIRQTAARLGISPLVHVQPVAPP